jgi:6-phosphogluconolactonase
MTLLLPNVYIFDCESDLLDSALRLWTRAFEEGLRRRKRFLTALSGGKTPISFYQKLAGQKRPDSWKAIHLFLVDERFGPPGHPDSNGRMITENLVRPAGIPPENVHWIPLGTETPEESARAYEEGLRKFFRLNPGEFPDFDFVLLGIGEDGHTASLFSGTPALEETARAVAAVRLDAIRRDRVTLTLPVLNRAAKVVFLVQGEEKAEIVYRVIVKRESSLPAARIQPLQERPSFFLDRGAGRQLSSHLQGNRGIS